MKTITVKVADDAKVNLTQRTTDTNKNRYVTLNKGDQYSIADGPATTPGPQPSPTPVPVPTPGPQPGWMTIANEGQPFTVTGTKTVRYGADTRWTQKTVTGGGQCTNAFFGDPAIGAVKSCQVSLIEPTPSPGPVPTPAPAPVPPPVPAGKPYTNPIILDQLADPAVIPYNNKFYLFATGSQNVWIATDMQGPYVKGPAVLASLGTIFIGSIFHDKVNARFYFFYSMGYPNFGLGVASSSAPDVPVTNHGLFPSLAGCYSGSFFEDDDGKQYLYMGVGAGWFTQVTAMKSPREPIGPVVTVVKPTQPWEMGKNPGEPGVTEGVSVIKHNGIYYFLYGGNWAQRQEQAAGYLTAPTPMGPFTKYPGNPIMKSGGGVFGPGFGTVLKDRAGDLWQIYAQHKDGDPADNWRRDICIDPIWFTPDGVLHCTPTRGVSMPGPR